MNNQPARLHKKENNVSPVNHIFDKIEAWAYAHAPLLLALFLIMGVVLFIILCFAICGISAVESGGMRNFINGGSL